MSELGPEDEALLRGARARLEATSDDQARVKRRLFAQLGIGIATGGSAISTSAGASASAGAATTVAAGTTLVTKLLITVAVVGLVSGGAFVAKGSRTHSNMAPPSASANAVNSPLPQQPELSASATASASPVAPLDTSQSLLPATPPIVNAPTHRSSIQTSDPVAASERATNADHAASLDTTNSTAQAVGVTPSNVGQAATLPTPVAAGPATVDAEAALLRNADAELKAGRADHALTLLDQHATQFPNGVLTEEREAERVVVLCALGRNQEAHDAAQAFLTARPRSPQAARIRSSCGGN